MKEAAESAHPSFIDDLVEDFEAPVCFEIRAPLLREADEASGAPPRGGQVFFFRNWADSDEYEEWQQSALAFAQMVVGNALGVKGTLPVHESWKTCLTAKLKVAIAAHMIAYLSVEPSREAEAGERLSPKLGQGDALILQKKSLHIFRLLEKAIDKHRFIYGVDDLVARVERAKKD